MAEWERLQTASPKEWQIGVFQVRNIKTPLTIEALRGRKYDWFADSRNGIVKMEFSSKHTKVVKKTLSIPSAVGKFFKEDTVIAYRDEDAFYLSSYKKGQEHLESFLKKEKVIK